MNRSRGTWIDDIRRVGKRIQKRIARLQQLRERMTKLPRWHTRSETITTGLRKDVKLHFFPEFDPSFRRSRTERPEQLSLPPSGHLSRSYGVELSEDWVPNFKSPSDSPQSSAPMLAGTASGHAPALPMNPPLSSSSYFLEELHADRRT